MFLCLFVALTPIPISNFFMYLIFFFPADNRGKIEKSPVGPVQEPPSKLPGKRGSYALINQYSNEKGTYFRIDLSKDCL